MYLFLYCEWLDSDLVKRYVPHAKFETKVTLADYKVAFTSFHEDGSDVIKNGGCHLESAPGNLLYGVLYEVSEDDVALIDRLTRVEFGSYTKKYIEVNGENGKTYQTVSHSSKILRANPRLARSTWITLIKAHGNLAFLKPTFNSLKKLR